MRNLLLLVILIGLVVFVYFFEEKKTINEIAEKTKREELFNTKNLGELQGIRSENLEINFVDDKIYSGNGLEVSPRKVNELLENFQKINVQRIFTENEVALLEKFNIVSKITLLFKGAEISLELGNPLGFDTSFYLRIKTKDSSKVVLARYTGELLSNITIDPNSVNEKNKNLAPWLEMKRLFSLTGRFFWVDSPFEEMEIDSVIIKTFRSPLYEINIKNYTTNPVILPGLSYLPSVFEDYLLKIKSIKAIHVEKMGLAPEGEIANLEIGNEKIGVFKKYLGKNGYFLMSKGAIFEINGDDFRDLISPLQSFWDKKLNLSPSDDIQIFDKANVPVLNKENWIKLLKGQAHSVSEHILDKSRADYIIRQNESVFYFASSLEGSEVYDVNNKLLYLFLTKLE